ncbi:lipopolysaccharide heptosyltransferase I [Cupriavidus metallidurans]|uniref:Lipopolysaccharide heptosyltransferase 1 n=2 Tax=Cupriavidus TaxID=106589 RepID=A0A3G8GVD6_9BURK|nr:MULTISPECIES: lipopolysaccharide heptosyltransferase I [Cupriavidus]AZG11950.1 lipopolysaccharide heptosyltransferase I [Cupriavidus pauculus]KAB0600873.1 lipopolysaccharide heptosyltransferase I [Cupriavidus pauculus]MDE4922449.1 lipopolysaccharide heptosyltransferase I [Cupriavidus metallidurans]QBP14588.1 lipopolysaccharide heptosyltransferase I [Cupriavidus metallidurans]UAL02645.1 lipopolysaccharide heptosyltransferase I [Cupriavidus pauculus]
MKRILVIKITSLGDMVHTLPLLYDLRRAYPEAKIDWIADASCADIPNWAVGVDRVIAPPLRQFKKNGRKWRDLRGIFSALMSLRRERYDVAIDVHGVYKSAIAARLARTKRRLGYAAEFLGEAKAVFAYTEIFGPHGDANCRQKMRMVVANALGYDIEPHETAELRVPAPATPLNADGVPRALLFHATSLEIKKWPQANWVEVGHQLARRGYRVQLPWGSQKEQQEAQALAAAIPGAEVLPRMSITECAQRVDAASLVVGMDTGFVHLADALGKPTVMLFTATSRPHFGVNKPGQSVSVGDNGAPPSVDGVLQAIHYVTHASPVPAGSAPLQAAGSAST